MSDEIMMMESPYIEVALPDLWGNLHKARINWLRHMAEDIWEAGLSYIDIYPYNEGDAAWAIQVDEEKREFIPLMNLLHVLEDELGKGQIIDKEV